MGGAAERFAEQAPDVRRSRSVEEGTFIHEYRGQLTDVESEVRFLTLAPGIADEVVHEAFTQVAGQWQNPSTHPNIVTVHDRGDTPRPWLATAIPKGDPIYVGSSSDLSFSQTFTVIKNTSEALRNAHLYNTAHLDLHPSQVYVTTNGDVQVRVDGWGLERACRVAAGQNPVAPHIAPELLDDPAGGTEQTDVYGLGVVAYYALTGQLPIASDSDIETAIRIGDIAPPSTVDPTVPPVVDDVMLQALATDPAERYESSYAFQTAIVSVLPEQPTTTPDIQADSKTDAEEGSATATDPEEEQSADDEGPTTDEEKPTTDAEYRFFTRRTALGLLGIGALGVSGFVVTEVGSTNNESDPTSSVGAGNNGDSDGGEDDNIGGGDTATPSDSVGGGSTDGRGGEPIPMGSIFPLTGALEAYGPGMQQAVDLAVEHINAAGGPLNRDINITHTDSGTRPSVGIRQFEQLRSEADIVGFVGAASSGISVPIAERVGEEEVMQVSNASTSPELAELGYNDEDVKFFARTAPNDGQQGIVMGRVLDDFIEAETAAFLYFDNPYGEGLANKASEAFSGETLNMVGYDQDAADYTSTLDQVFEDDPDGVGFVGYPGNGTTIMKQWDQGGYGGEWVLSEGVNSKSDFFEPLSDIVEGMYLASPQPEETDGASRFEEAMGEENTLFAPHAYDAMFLMALAIERAGEATSTAIAQNIRAVSRPEGETVTINEFDKAKQLLADGNEINYEGASSPVRLNENLETLYRFGILQVRDAQSETIDTVARSEFEGEL